MANVSNLTSKILKDAEERKEKILAEANEKKANILSKKKKEAEKLEAEMIEKATREAETRKERVISGAELSARNKKLEAKQAIITDVFNMSIESLCNLKEDDYKSFIKNTILSLNIDGDEKLILNDKVKNIVDNSFLAEINEALVKNNKLGKLTVSNETANYKGGFILEKNGIEINNTFEALVTSLREELEFEVAKELFN